MSSIAAELREAGLGLTLHLQLPEGARDVPSAELPAVDVSGLAGGRVVLRRGLEADGLQVRAVCIAASSSRWAPGVEDLVLERASGLVRAGAGAVVERWDPGPIGATGPRFEQSFAGAGRAGDAPVSIRGRHVLGFAGVDRSAVLCSVVCLEPSAGSANPPEAPSGRCDSLVGATRIEGTFVTAPEPGLLVRSILFAADQPYVAAAMGVVLGALVVVLVLARRPRPRPR